MSSRAQKKIHGVCQLDFPISSTLEQIAWEYELVHTSPTTLLVLGLSESDSNNIVNAILSSACDDTQSVDHLRENMVRSLRKEEDLTIDEMITKELCPLKLRYFAAVKDKFSFEEYQTFSKMYESAKRNLKDKDSDLDADQRKKIEREIIYRRLSRFTQQSITSSFCVDRHAVYPLLFIGFMRQHQVKEDVIIPQDVVDLIMAFYVHPQVSNQTRSTIKSVQFSIEKTVKKEKEVQRFNILQPRGMNVDYWSGGTVSEWERSDRWGAMRRRGMIDGIIFVIDLTTYNETMVDEEGKKWNKLQYALRARDIALELFEPDQMTTKVTVLTNMHKLRDKIKNAPMSACPLFMGKEATDDLDLCIEAVGDKVASSFCVDGVDREEIFDKLKSKTQWFR
jgi:hypothetical protein